MKKKIALLFCTILLLCLIPQGCDVYSKNKLRNQLFEAEETWDLGQKRTVWLKSKNSDYCLLCAAYTSKSLIDKYNLDISSTVAKKIEDIIYYGEENWAVFLIEDNSIIFHCFLPCIYVLSDDIGGNQAMEYHKINGKYIGLTFEMTDNSRPLKLIEIISNDSGKK